MTEHLDGFRHTVILEVEDGCSPTGEVQSLADDWRRAPLRKSNANSKWIGVAKFRLVGISEPATRGVVPPDLWAGLSAVELRREVLYDVSILDSPMPVYIEEDSMFISFPVWNFREDREPRLREEDAFLEYSIDEGTDLLRDEYAPKTRYFVYASRYIGDPVHEEIQYAQSSSADCWAFGTQRGVYLRVHRQERSYSYRPTWLVEALAKSALGISSLCFHYRYFTDGTSDHGVLEWANDPLSGDTWLPWTGYAVFVDDRCSEDFRPPDMGLLPNPILSDGVYGMPSVIEYDDDSSEEGEERPEPWVVDSGTTFHILSEDEVVAMGVR